MQKHKEEGQWTRNVRVLQIAQHHAAFGPSFSARQGLGPTMSVVAYGTNLILDKWIAKPAPGPISTLKICYSAAIGSL